MLKEGACLVAPQKREIVNGLLVWSVVVPSCSVVGIGVYRERRRG
jgi:hypothetical protein